MNLRRWIILIILVSILGWGLFKLDKLKDENLEKIILLENQKTKLEKENEKLIENISFLKNPQNLIREIKSQTNYTKPNEKIIILVEDLEKLNEKLKIK
jgi:cell division protein FtsB